MRHSVACSGLADPECVPVCACNAMSEQRFKQLKATASSVMQCGFAHCMPAVLHCIAEQAAAWRVCPASQIDAPGTCSCLRTGPHALDIAWAVHCHACRQLLLAPGSGST